MNERSIFLAALEIRDPAERARLLDQACGRDTALRREVEDLLAAHARSGSFMPDPASEPTETAREPGEGPGSRVGPYKLLQQIGEGGMGAVFMAEQEQPVRRMVALKIVRNGMDSKAILARFEAERQALALMDHPNIARVLDAGATASGRPFFVMELVKGLPITRFCDERQLSLRERLELFVPVCQAIQHAHQKGVIHRDIKPSNVLVALYDDKPTPKVIDFGVAKATSQKLTDKTLFTAFGSVVGTLEYMSPEQAKLNQLDVDTRSDVYGLGVLLYELLTGTTPLDRARLKAAALDEVLRLIREEEPPRPSTRLSAAPTRPQIAAGRGAEPIQRDKLLRGELDWIVMKSLEKDRSRRYDTAGGLARDIERYLRDEPVEACPPTLGYRLRKGLRKNRAAVAVAAAFLAIVFTAAAMSTALAVQALRAERAAAAERDRALASEQEANLQRAAAERERQRAEEEKRSAQAVRDFLQDDLLRQANPLHQAEMRRLLGDDAAVNPNPSVLELLERAAAQLSPERIDARFPGMPVVQAEALMAVGDAYFGIQEDARAEPFLSRAHDLLLATRGPEHPATLDAGHKLARALLAMRRFEKADPLMEQVLAGQARVLGPYHAKTLKTRLLVDLATLRTQGPEACIARLRRHKEEAMAHGGAEDASAHFAAYFLGHILQQSGHAEEGLKEMESVRDAARRSNVRPDHPDVEAGVQMLFRAYRAHKRDKEAAALLEEHLADCESRDCAPSAMSSLFRHQLAWLHMGAGRAEEAIQLFERNIELSLPPHDETALESLGQVYLRVDRVDEALAVLQRAHDLKLKRNGAAHKSYVLGRIRTRIGQALLRQSKPLEAEPFLVEGYREMVEHLDQRPPSDTGHPETIHSVIVNLYKSTGRPEQAAKWQAEWAMHNLRAHGPAEPN